MNIHLYDNSHVLLNLIMEQHRETLRLREQNDDQAAELRKLKADSAELRKTKKPKEAKT